MIKRIFRRSVREPVSYIAVTLFATILTVILCYIYRAGQEEQRNFENTFHSIPVEFEITKLNGNRLDESDYIDEYRVDLFLEDSISSSNFNDLVSELQLRMAHTATLVEKPVIKGEEDRIKKRIVGISSVKVAEELTPEYGGTIEWYSGFDESIFNTDQFVCIVPSNYIAADEVVLSFLNKDSIQNIDNEFTCSFSIVGRYIDDGNDKIYCPYATMEIIYEELRESKKVQRLMGKLKCNNDLELLHEMADNWFAEPNPMGVPALLDKFENKNYPFAMDIKDSLLKNLVLEMKNSMEINRIAAVVVFVLATSTGFSTGVCAIYFRKREIGLMRTLGMSNSTVCVEFLLEQVVFVIIGIIIGGSYSLWEPIAQLVLLTSIYIIGLSTALLVFIRGNLLATMKEDN